MTPSSNVAGGASVVDLFCGAGGLSYGFRTAGFDVAAGIDIDEDCRFPYEYNVKAPFLRTDVATLSPMRAAELFRQKGPRVLVGCAPCQPFSSYNQKNEDPKWALLERFGDLVGEIRPDVVSMENVPRLTRFKQGRVFDGFVDRLRDQGYEVSYGVLFAPDFGLAQRRSRLVLLASLLGPITLPAPTHRGAHRTVRDEIGALPKLEDGKSDPHDPLHRSSALSRRNLRRIVASAPGGTWRDWPVDLVADCHRVETGKGYSSVYGRMEWDKSAPTVTTQFFGFGNGRFGHPEQHRALSLREGAMLQGFPRDYQFVPAGGKVFQKTIGRLVGNAVPVTLAEAIARSVRNHLEVHA